MEEFYIQIILSLQSITDKVKNVDMVNAFWDDQYEGRKIITRKPKREPNVKSTIQGLLYDIAILKNIEIIPEYPIGGGLLDFLMLGQIEENGMGSVCIEFKHAHSDDLEHGLIKQLPAYMRAKGTDYGIYCVLYFKGLDFDEPKSGKDELLQKLNSTSSDMGLGNIKILVIDLSIELPPSRI